MRRFGSKNHAGGQNTVRCTRSIGETCKQIFLLAFFLEAIVLAVATEPTTSDPGAVIDENHKLMSLNTPSIDLDLSGLNLRSIDPNAFINCASAKTLNLSNNSLNELPESVFVHLVDLQHLSLANNDLTVTKNAFLGLNQLKSLNISNNPLKKILNENNFAGLTKSCDIHVSGWNGSLVISPLAFGKEKLNSSITEGNNETSAMQEKKCSGRSSMYLPTLLDTFAKEIDSNVRVKVCIDDKVVKLVDVFNADDTLSSNCKNVTPDLNKRHLEIMDFSIESFEKGWFKIENLPFNSIYLDYNKISNITSDLLNDLPQNIKYVSFKRNKIVRVNRGVIVTEHLQGLDLSYNDITVIEEDAFVGTNLTHLYLASNSLTDVTFVLTLPANMVTLNLDANDIHEIPDRSFAHLKRLLHLIISFNNVTQLHLQSLSGLESLQLLDVGYMNLEHLQPDLFKDLANLHELNLYGNKLSKLDNGVFNGLGCLEALDLNTNKLTEFTKDTLSGVSENLETLSLQDNELESLKADSFVKIPKSDLWLSKNKIQHIEKNAFDLPYLTYLTLEKNNITSIEKGAAKNLGNLGNEILIKLMSNPIERLENGALGGLPIDATVDLSNTAIEVIQAGVFDDL